MQDLFNLVMMKKASFAKDRINMQLKVTKYF